MSLTALKIKNAQSLDKPYKLADGSGSYLWVTPAGGKLWRLDYRFAGKRKTLTLGKVWVSVSEMARWPGLWPNYRMRW